MKSKVLVVDDDQSICQLLKIFLGKKYQVTAVEDGLLAMYMLSAGKIPDVIICDLWMPRINGIELVANLNISGLYKHIPVIMLSGDESTAIRDKCMAFDGVLGYVTKPFDPEVLDDLVREGVRLSNERKSKVVYR